MDQHLEQLRVLGSKLYSFSKPILRVYKNLSIIVTSSLLLQKAEMYLAKLCTWQFVDFGGIINAKTDFDQFAGFLCPE